MDIIKNTLEVGAEKPFVFLHISDIHMSEYDENDDESRKAYISDRKNMFSFSPEAVEFVKQYVQKTGYPIINTGDMLDFITPENLRLAKEFIQQTDMIFVAGNHEYWYCPNNRFHYDDVLQTHEGRYEALDMLSEKFGMDIRFSCTEINGVNLVCIDDSDYCIDEDIFEKLKAVEAQGKPILLFLHIPLYSEQLGDVAKYSLNAPEKYFENSHPVDVWERKPDELTCEICEHIKSSPLIKCVFGGHTHHNAQMLDGGLNQIITGCNTVREVTVI